MLYERTLGQWLEHWAETTPDKDYIVYSDRNLRFTWSQFNRRVDDMAKGLIAIGVERGTHVGIWAANVPDWLTLLYACAKIGAVYVTVNTNYKQSELEYPSVFFQPPAIYQSNGIGTKRFSKHRWIESGILRRCRNHRMSVLCRR